MACFLVSISVGTVTSFGLPVHPAVTIFGYITYALFLVYWQSLRRLWRQKLVFLDKVCVPQDQEELKKASIHGLSAFLDRSEELLVLWSSKYLTRLWCTFEAQQVDLKGGQLEADRCGNPFACQTERLEEGGWTHGASGGHFST